MNIDNIVDNYDRVSKGSAGLMNGLFALSNSLPSNSKALKALGVVGVINTSVSLVRTAYDFWSENLRKERFGYKLEVSGNTMAYRTVIPFFMEDPSVVGDTDESYMLTVSDVPTEDNSVRAKNVGILSQEMTIFGVDCEAVYVPKNVGISSNEEKVSAVQAGSYYDRLIIGFETPNDRNKFIEKLSAKTQDNTKSAPKLYKASSGFLEFKSHIRPRSLDSVFLKDGQMDRLVNGISTFKKNAAVYDDLELPYHMGILLHGPAGTGKSTTINALASHFSMSIVWVNLASIQDDESLLDVLDDVPENSLIVFEEVDSVNVSNDRSDLEHTNQRDNSSNISQSVFLNVIDGQFTPRGSVFVFTTNYKDRLDSALIRPGRIDYDEKIDYLDDYQFRKFFEYVFKKPAEGFPEITPEYKISPATIMGEMKKEIGDMDLAEKKVREFIGGLKNG